MTWPTCEERQLTAGRDAHAHSCLFSHGHAEILVLQRVLLFRTRGPTCNFPLVGWWRLFLPLLLRRKLAPCKVECLSFALTSIGPRNVRSVVYNKLDASAMPRHRRRPSCISSFRRSLCFFVHDVYLDLRRLSMFPPPRLNQLFVLRLIFAVAFGCSKFVYLPRRRLFSSLFVSLTSWSSPWLFRMWTSFSLSIWD